MQTNAFREKFERNNLKRIFADNYPLLSILIGYLFVALTIGPFYNSDTAIEYNAVSGVLKYGLPKLDDGNFINQPPLGFYSQAFFLNMFGSSISNGTFLVTLFGLGCIVLVYGIANTVYNKTTAFFAATLFAFSPWHLILSRTFLIDVQCLFFSLFSLFLGIFAVRRDSIKLFLGSGIIFAMAFSTKLYAVFILIPILAFFFFFRSEKIRQKLIWLGAFSAPTLLFSFLWYQTIAKVGMGAIIFHTDFAIHESSGIVPSYFFVSNFLTSYGLGWLFVDAAILSLFLCFTQKRLFRRFLAFDIISLLTIICIISVNTFLGATLKLNSPYLTAIKYDYQSLPFFAFLAGSLITKSISLINLSKLKKKVTKITYVFAASIGLILVPLSIGINMSYVNLFSTWTYLLFKADSNLKVGYSFFSDTPIGLNNILFNFQYLGYALMISGIVWLSRHKISSLLKTVNVKMHSIKYWTKISYVKLKRIYI